MRTAILVALLAVGPGLSARSEPQSKPPVEQAAPQPPQQAEAQPPMQSPKATIPSGLSNGGQPVKPVLPTAPDTDPLKLAAPMASNGAKPAGTPPAEKSYVIGAEDQLFIQVWQNSALSGTFIVAPDGRISMGLINEVMAAGLTRDELQSEIIRRLKEGGFLRDPTVTVNVTGFNSKKYSIEGEVNKSGSFPLVVPTTVLDALVNAGGFRDFANKTKIRILRGNKTYLFNYKQVIAGKNRDQNIKLEPGDLIIVK